MVTANEAVFVGQGFVGQAAILSGNQSMPDKKERRRDSLPDKEIDERRGWIEYAKRGTKNPKRYAYRRRWKRENGQWVKSKVKRMKSILPLTEEDYVKRIRSEGRDTTTGRKRRDRRHRGVG